MAAGVSMQLTIPTLETERLILRPWRESDLDGYAEFRVDETTARFVGGVCDRDEAWRRMAMLVGHWTLRGYGPWALEDRATARFAGYCGAYFPEGWPEPEITWGLHSAFQHRGYATEAARRARAYAYCELGLATIVSLIVPENLPSARVATRLGAVREREIVLRGKLCGVYRHPGPDKLN